MTHFFVLSELHNLDEKRLESFGIVKSVNRSRLKNKLLDKFPEAQEQSDGRNSIIVKKKKL